MGRVWCPGADRLNQDEYFLKEGTLRRLSLATLVSVVVGLCAGAASAEVGSSLAHRSADLTRSYLHTWSTNGRAALADVPRLYAPQVSFYGRLLNHDALIREKAQFLRRWPIRHYALRPGTMRVTCDAQGQRCAVRSIIDWRAASSARKVVIKGIIDLRARVRFRGFPAFDISRERSSHPAAETTRARLISQPRLTVCQDRV